MAVTVLTSAKGAPGVSTTALAMTLQWPRPAVLVEADMAGSSSILAGYLRGSRDHSHGLVGLGLARRQRPLTVDDVWVQTLELAPDRHLLPGIADPAQSHALTSMWGSLSEVLASLERAGVDVVVDAGRLGTAYAPTPLLRAADLVLLVTGSRLPDVAATRARATPLTADLTHAGTGADALALLVVGEGRPYSAREISTALGPRALPVAWDPVTAEVFAVGAPPGRRIDGAPLTRSVRATVTAVRDMVAARRDRLAPHHAAAGHAPDTPATWGSDA